MLPGGDDLRVVALTGTPGTGKSGISAELKKRGYEVLEMAALIDSLHVHTSFNPEYGSREVDTDELRTKVDGHLSSMKPAMLFLSGHLSHFATCSTAVVLRCEPHTLRERLRRRGWNEVKILENVRAEILDVILVEASERIKDVFEVDTTGREVTFATDIVLDAVVKMPDSLRPGRINWAGEIEEWF